MSNMPRFDSEVRMTEEEQYGREIVLIRPGGTVAIKSNHKDDTIEVLTTRALGLLRQIEKKD